jgi:hypothetical protein
VRHALVSHSSPRFFTPTIIIFYQPSTNKHQKTSTEARQTEARKPAEGPPTPPLVTHHRQEQAKNPIPKRPIALANALSRGLCGSPPSTKK